MVVSQESASEAFAFDRQDGRLLRVTTELDSKIYSISMSTSSLEDSGISPGEVALVPPGEDAQPAVPEGADVYEANLDTARFDRLSETPESLRGSFIPDLRVRKCPILLETVLELEPWAPKDDWSNFAVALDERRAIVGTRSGILVELTHDTHHLVTLRGLGEIPTAMTTFGSELWVGTASGSVHRGTYSDGDIDDIPFEALPRPSELAIDRLGVTVHDGRSMVLALDRARKLFLFDGQSWAQIHAFPLDDTIDRSSDIFSAANGELLAISLSEPNIVRLRDGQVELEAPTNPPVSGFNRGVFIPGHGSYLSTTFGDLYSDTRGAWVFAIEPSMKTIKRALIADGGDLIAGSRAEYEYFLVDEGRRCGNQASRADIDPFASVKVGEYFLFGGRTSSDAPGILRFVWVTLER
ncbi:MAG: hypothetical protein HY791_03430 [Deltaproteobacteria bacterium]|nr:hypothetical protein [Deltaproteobacteria bacterium]